ncbi:MAG: hypothetical protein N3I35_19130 [Clostridia bacterium]|nr:hypothetical protein [Clostridia bacterium]
MKNDKKSLFFMAQKGDVAAYEKLIESYEKKIFSLVFAATGDRTEASELTQDIFIKVYKELRNEKSDSRLAMLIYKTTHKMLFAAPKSFQSANMKEHGLNMI